MNCEDVGIGFLILGAQIAGCRIGAEAARVDTHHVDGWFALDDPVGELPPGSTGSGDPKTVALVEPEIGKVPRRPDDRATVRCVGDGAVVDLLDPHLAERWDAGNAASICGVSRSRFSWNSSYSDCSSGPSR